MLHFYDRKCDIDWAFAVHIPSWQGTGLHTNTVCMILHGNEDSPTKLELFSVNHYKAKPVVFIQDSETGNLIKE